jgi:hypothetical protein
MFSAPRPLRLGLPPRGVDEARSYATALDVHTIGEGRILHHSAARVPCPEKVNASGKVESYPRSYSNNYVSPVLPDVVSQKQFHNMLHSGASDVPQIALPRDGTVGVLHDFVAWKVIHVLMRGGPLLCDCS